MNEGKRKVGGRPDRRLLAVFPCGGEMFEVLPDGTPGTKELFTAGDPDKRARRFPELWVLLCGSAEVNIQLCPRLQELREVQDARRRGREPEHIPAWLSELEGTWVTETATTRVLTASMQSPESSWLVTYCRVRTSTRGRSLAKDRVVLITPRMAPISAMKRVSESFSDSSSVILIS